MNEPSTKELFKLLAPFLAMTLLVSVMATVLLLKFAPIRTSATVQVEFVTFDVVRFANAQRAVASKFLKPNSDQAGASELLLNLSERSREAITEVAGEGVLVVLKQAIVQGQTRDITEDVLRKLGMPVDVPTSDPVAYTLDVAPTMLFNRPGSQARRALPGEGSSRGGVLP